MEHKNRERNSPRVRHAWQTPSLRNHRTEHRAESRTAMSTINRADQRSDRLHAGWRLGSDGLRLPWLDRHFCTKRAALLLLATFGMQGATSVWNAPFAAISGLLNRRGPPPGRPIAPLRSPIAHRAALGAPRSSPLVPRPPRIFSRASSITLQGLPGVFLQSNRSATRSH